MLRVKYSDYAREHESNAPQNNILNHAVVGCGKQRTGAQS